MIAGGTRRRRKESQMLELVAQENEQGGCVQNTQNVNVNVEN